YFDRVERMSITTLPNSSWRQGRTTTLTFSVSLVVLFNVRDPTVPRFAVFSSAAGVTDKPPLWACAVAVEPSTPAQATTIGTARRGVSTDTIRPLHYCVDPEPNPQPAAPSLSAERVSPLLLRPI